MMRILPFQARSRLLSLCLEHPPDRDFYFNDNPAFCIPQPRP